MATTTSLSGQKIAAGAVALGLVLIVAGVAAATTGSWPFDKSKSPVPDVVQPTPDSLPAEFLFLDRYRVLDYLSQVDEGLSDAEQRSLVTSGEGGLNATIEGFGAEAKITKTG